MELPTEVVDAAILEAQSVLNAKGHEVLAGDVGLVLGLLLGRVLPHLAPALAVRDTDPLERIIREGNRDHVRIRERMDTAYWWNWLRLQDGTVLSVIAGSGAYCSPRPGWGVPEEYSGPYAAVEAWFPDEDEPRSTDVDELRAWVAARGGVVAVAARQECLRDRT